jgi:hypothetical protein
VLEHDLANFKLYVGETTTTTNRKMMMMMSKLMGGHVTPQQNGE